MNELSKLKPIKPNVPIHSQHHYLWWIIGFFLILILIVIVFYIYKYIKIKKEKTELFKLINNPKKFAYEFTKKAKKYKNKKNEKLLDDILNRLRNYKYKKKVEKIDENTKQLIKKFLGLK